MTDNNHVYCPWCGSEMELHEVIRETDNWAYVCECGAVSPIEMSRESAIKAAQQRPMQKPLTREEAAKNPDVVYLESKVDDGDGYAVKTKNECYLVSDGSWLDLLDTAIEDAEKRGFPYGKFWRCWATKPTDEERSAAEWDDE